VTLADTQLAGVQAVRVRRARTARCTALIAAGCIALPFALALAVYGVMLAWEYLLAGLLLACL
jgi:hypothetical protein